MAEPSEAVTLLGQKNADTHLDSTIHVVGCWEAPSQLLLGCAYTASFIPCQVCYKCPGSCHILDAAVCLQSISKVVAGQSLWAVLAIFCGLVLVGTTFISHTVGAMVILPIVQAVGQQMPGGDHSKLLVMGAALMCSGG